MAGILAFSENVVALENIDVLPTTELRDQPQLPCVHAVMEYSSQPDQ